MTFRKNLLFAALVLTGCGQMDREDQFRAGLPTKEMVEVKSPDKKGQSLPGDVQAQAKDATSEFYQLTRGATVLVNGGTLAVLGLVEAVTKHPPTTLAEESAVWGPHSEALARNAWRLTVKKAANNTYAYALAAKAKEDPDTAFVDVLTGTQTASVDAAGEIIPGFGKGEFTLDWDKIQTLPEHKADEMGRLTVKYSRLDATSAVTVEAQFRQVFDTGDKTRKDLDYGYSSIPGQGGQFDFKQQQSITGSSRPETLTIKSRWQETGAGRSDVKVSGGDLVTPATLNECWNTSFASRYLRYSWSSTPEYGVETTDCVFTAPVYSSL